MHHNRWIFVQYIYVPLFCDLKFLLLFYRNADIISSEDHRTSLQYVAAAAAKLLQTCLTLCNPIDSSPPGSPVPGILQARTLEWVAISFSNAWKWKVKVKSLSCVRLPATPWTAAHQAPPSMGFSRQEYRSGVPLSTPVHATYCFSICSWLTVWWQSLHATTYRFSYNI